MPRHITGMAKPKEKTSLPEARYDSAAATKSMNTYEKFLYLREQAAKAALARMPRRQDRARRGGLCTLFATLH